MLIGSFLAGSIPLAFKLSESRLRYFSALSVGLLMGTALLIIIPEGVETLYSAEQVTHTTLHARSLEARSASTGIDSTQWQNHNLAHWDSVMFDRRAPADDEILNQYGSKVGINDDMDDVDARPVGNSGYPTSKSEHAQVAGTLEDGIEEHEPSAHQYIGLALVLGFAVMFLIDQVSSLHVHGSSNSASQQPIEFTELNLMLEAVEEEDEEEIEDENETVGLNESSSNKDSHALSNSRRDPSSTSAVGRFRQLSPKGPSQLTPTVGLVVHAAADGIALGASARHPHLSFVIFFAIMIHKAPSAFALTTVLMNEGFMRARIRRHLFVFSIAAPIGAILTYAALIFSGDANDQTMAWWTGMLLIFSGGTFLYVAMHVLEEVKNHAGKKSHGYRNNDHHHDKMGRSEVACVLIGMFIPAILNMEHGH
ncbi:hypothetical protein Unana1_00253 [Umbelopsis nana]